MLKLHKRVAGLIVEDFGYGGVHFIGDGPHYRDLCRGLTYLVHQDGDLEYFFDSDDPDSIEEGILMQEVMDNRRRSVSSILDIFRDEKLTDKTVKDIGVHIWVWFDNIRKVIPSVPWDGFGCL